MADLWQSRFVQPPDSDAGDGSGLLKVDPRGPDDPYPPRLIIPASDLLNEFKLNARVALHDKDVEQIMAHVVQSLLLSEENGDLEAMDWEMDFNSMRSSDLFKSEAVRGDVKHAMSVMCFKLFERLRLLQAYHEGEFPYFLDRLMPCGDLLLSKLPH